MARQRSLTARDVLRFDKAASTRLSPLGFLSLQEKTNPLRTRRLKKDLEWWRKEAAKHGVSGMDCLP